MKNESIVTKIISSKKLNILSKAENYTFAVITAFHKFILKINRNSFDKSLV